MLYLYTQCKLKIHTVDACLLVRDTRTYTAMCVPSHMCLHSLKDSLVLQTTIHARQSYFSQYMLGKAILAIQNPGMLQHAPVAECGAEYPLVIFSHGIGGNRIAYSAIICSLVRQVHQSFRIALMVSPGILFMKLLPCPACCLSMLPIGTSPSISITCLQWYELV